jgi:putative endonuclease
MCPRAIHLQSGESAESLAWAFLEKRGFKLIQKNFRTKVGEIDLIMKQKSCLVFIEVRYRKNQDFGGAAASITASKQTRIRKTALIFLQQNPGLDYKECRFDVIAISGIGDNTEIQWIDNAFQ